MRNLIYPPRRCVVAAIALSIGLGGASFAAAPKADQTSADEVPVARAYLNWVHKDIDAIEAEMPTITPAADTLAEAFIKTRHLAVSGEGGMMDELCGRAGGFGQISVYNTTIAGEPLIYAMGIAHKGEDVAKLLETQIAAAKKAHDSGSPVVAVVSVAQLQSLGLLDRAKAAVTAIIDTHAGATDGQVFSKEDPTPFPTHTVANTVALWTLASEVYGACTRRGESPVVLQSMTTDTKLVRYKKYEGQAFHTDLHLTPVAPGVLGKEYDDALRSLLRDIGTASWKSVAKACDRMAGTIDDGGKVYIFAQVHEPQYHHGGQLANDPGPFVMLNDAGGKMVGKPGLKDFAIAYGYSWGPDDLIEGSKTSFWSDPNVIRGAGRGVCWVMTTTYGLDRREIHANEMVIDERWAPGDALVKIPGYEVNMAPSSGAVVETLMWAMEAQVHAMVAEQAKHTIKK